MTTDDDEAHPLLDPDDLGVQRQYFGRLEWRLPNETAAVEKRALQTAVYEGLKTCRSLRINDPKEIVRFLALALLLTPAQKQSPFLTTIVYRILLATEAWGARKRLRFIYKYIVGRTPPDPEPNFGVWFIADPRFCPPVTPDDLKRSIFNILPNVDSPS